MGIGLPWSFLNSLQLHFVLHLRMAILNDKWNTSGYGFSYCSGQFLTYTRIKTYLTTHQKLPKTDNRICQVDFLLESISRVFLMSLILSRNQRPRGYSSFWEIHCPEDTPPSESVANPKSILSVPSKMVVTTDLSDICSHSWSLLRCQVISHFKCYNNSYFSTNCYRS